MSRSQPAEGTVPTSFVFGQWRASVRISSCVEWGIRARGRGVAVVLPQTHVAPDKLEKEEHARTLQPRNRLRTVHFKTETVRAASQPNSTHRNTAENMGREERYRNVISGMEPRRIAVMLLPHRKPTLAALRGCKTNIRCFKRTGLRFKFGFRKSKQALAFSTSRFLS
jgi:hypothetical protein